MYLHQSRDVRLAAELHRSFGAEYTSGGHGSFGEQMRSAMRGLAMRGLAIRPA